MKIASTFSSRTSLSLEIIFSLHLSGTWLPFCTRYFVCETGVFQTLLSLASVQLSSTRADMNSIGFIATLYGLEYCELMCAFKFLTG